MRHINPGKAAAATGMVLALWHALWASLVAAGLAQALVDLILHLHFMQLQITIAPFALATATELVVITGLIGAGFGLIFALVWNWLAGKPAAT